MDFTREPIIETIITPKEGYKLVVRSSKSAGQEEYFVEAIEVVSFGHALFFRSLERPKAFMVPVSDYEVLEVRETRMVLKNAGLDRSIKIGGGREGAKTFREQEKKEVISEEEKESLVEGEEPSTTESPAPARAEPRLDKKRDRRRNYRKRRGREDKDENKEGKEEGAAELTLPPLEEDKVVIPPPLKGDEVLANATGSNLFSSLLQPPPTLISETINRYRENALFKNAFFLSDEEQYKPHDKVQDLLSEDDEHIIASHLSATTFVADQATENSVMDPATFENEEAAVSSLLAESLENENEEIKEEETQEELAGLPIDSTQGTSEEVEVSFINSNEEEQSDHLSASSYFRENFFENNEDEEEKAALPLYAEEEAIETNGEEDLSVASFEEQKDKNIQSLPLKDEN